MGKCKECNIKISWQYPLVEFITPLLFILLYLKFGFSFMFFQYIILFSVGIIIFFIDLYHQIIPDTLSLPLIPLGILLSLHPSAGVNVKDSLAGAITGFLLFYFLAWSYWRFRNKMGLGGGDIKLIAGLGAFIGLVGLIFVILISSVTALITILAIRYDINKQFSFGPFMIFAVVIYVLYGHNVIMWYLSLY